MTLHATQFTPEVLLSAPRRSGGTANSDASKVLYSVSTYSFSEHEKSSEVRILDVASQQTVLVTDDKTASEPTWLDDETVLLLKSNEDETTEFVVGAAEGFEKSKYTAGKLEGPVGDLKIYKLGDGEFAVAVSGKATPEGSLYQPSKAKKPLTTGKLYTTTFVRHWDHYITENRNAIWLAKLSKTDGKFVLSKLKNALKGSKLESPIDPFGGTDHFDISKHGLVFTAKDPDLNPALHTKTNIYVSAKDGFWDQLTAEDQPELQSVKLEGFEGASTSPVWSSDGKKIAFLSMRTDGYESDKNQPFIIPDYTDLNKYTTLFATDDNKGTWDRSPQSIAWSPDDTHIYFTAEENGRASLFQATLSPTPSHTAAPTLLVRGGSISTAQVLSNSDIFLTSTSLVDNSLYSLLPLSTRPDHTASYTLPAHGAPASPTTTTLISSATHTGAKLGLSPSQVRELHFPGAAPNTSIHAWLILPPSFSPSSHTTYPLAYLIHGGPQGAWLDGWSTRWNPFVLASQGYVVACPNPTGSTSYGQAFCDAIRGEWGGLPYHDLAQGLAHIRATLPFVDTARAVALGASYGGYMVNWINGQPLGRAFRALVSHDGIFSTAGLLATEELYFPARDLAGWPWDRRAAWDRWDPARFTQHWSTPQLVVHSERDYRLSVSEGLAAFNVLQARGVESELLLFADENHWVLKHENSLRWHEVVLDWVNAHVGLEKYTVARDRARGGVLE